MQTIILALVIIAAPIVAALMERVSNAGLSERRHSHHDTYVVPASLTRSLVIDMALMAIMGISLGAFCTWGVFSADPFVVMAFFASFTMVMFVQILNTVLTFVPLLSFLGVTFSLTICSCV